MKFSQNGGENVGGMSLVELLIVVAVIGVIAAIAIPTISKINESSRRAVAMGNAKNVASMSAALSALGAAHVIPDSMGGVEATARLLREGVVVPEGPTAGERMSLPALSDEEITELSKYLDIQYGKTELMLVYLPEKGNQTMLLFKNLTTMLATWRPARLSGTAGS